MYIILAILIFGFLVISHEFGHFAVAKACGVRVLEFSVGMGPAIFSKEVGETKYSLRCLPIGGFCAMEGEDGDSIDPRAFSNQAVWKKLLILIAGAGMNFLTGLVLILLVFAKTDSFSTPTITGFFEGCPYQGEDMLMEGDTFYKINGERIYFSSDVATYIQRGGGETSDIVIIRDGKKIYLDDFPLQQVEYETDSGTVMKYGLYFQKTESGFWAHIKYAWYSACDFVRLVRLSLTDLVSGALGIKDMSGVVGIVSVMNDVGKSADSVSGALVNIGYLAAFIAINLAVMNMLPIPALDGGRVLFLILTWIIETISRRKLNPKYEGYINSAGLVVLMGLMVFIMFNDIYKLIAK